MAKERDDIQLGFQVEMETRKAVTGLAALDKSLRNITRRNQSLKWDDKKGFGDFKKRFTEYRKSLRSHQKEMTQLRKSIRDVGGAGHASQVKKNFASYAKSYDKFEKDIRAAEKKLHEQVRKVRSVMQNAETKEQKEALEEQLKQHQKTYAKEVSEAKKMVKEKQRALSRSMGGPGKAMIMEKHGELVASRKKAAEEFQQALSDLKTAEVGKDMAEGFADGISSLSGRDILGAAKAGTRISGQLFKGAGKLGMKWGRDLQIMGTGMGGKKGAVVAGAGAGLAKLGPMIASLSKLVPILSMASTVMGSFIKLLVDVEAHAKEMNKAILEGASTAEILQQNMGGVGRASKSLSGTLDTIRDQATDVRENFKWGSTKDQIIQVINTLNQQGATLNSLEQAFGNVQRSAHKSAAEVGSFGELARTSLAFSRVMGVSLQEITDFQAEMFTELGQSVTGTKLEFARMTREASESGIATNKFFQIIRGVSSDLGLYNTRLDTAASLLKVLGRSMNPREAGKFLQFATAGVQKMDQLQRTRIGMFAGQENTQAAIGQDIASKLQSAVVDVAGHMGDKSQANLDRLSDLFKDFMRGNDEALETALAKVPDATRGGLVDAFVKMRRTQKELGSGAVGAGAAMANAGPGAILTLLEQSAKNVFNTPLEKLVGEQGLAFRNANQISEEQFDQLVAMRFAIQGQRRDMAKALAGTLGNPEKQAAILEQLNARKITKAEDLDKLSTSDILAITEAVTPAKETDAEKQMKFAQEQAKHVVTIEDKVGMIVDGIFNYLYKALRALIEAIHDIMDAIPGIKKPDRTLLNALDASRTGKNADVVDRLKDIALLEKDPNKARQDMIRTVAQSVQKNWSEKAKSGDVSAMAARDLEKIFKSESAGSRALKANAALNYAGIGTDKKTKFLESMKTGGSMATAIKSAGLTPEEIQKFYDKALYTVGKENIGNITALEMMGAVVPAAATKAALPAIPAAVAATPTATTPSPFSATTPSTQTMAYGQREAVDVLDMNGREMVDSFQSLYDALRRRGIMLDKTQLNGSFKEAVRDGTLQAMRTALFEYALYSSNDQARMLERMKSTGVGADLATSYEASRLPANAMGGEVVGLAAGRAVVASPGEGLASVGKGEKIVPSGGGGGGGITINVNGLGGADLANHLRQKVAEGIYEYKRREKYS